MAGSSMAFTYDTGVDGGGYQKRVTEVICDWVSDDTTGAVTGTTRKIVGRLIKAITDPGAVAPTDNYDIVLTDDNGVDLLASTDATLADRDTTNNESVYFFLKNVALAAMPVAPIVCSTVTVAVTNAGNSKAGKLILFVEN